jgi:DNA-directed RNA polymerase specialized sigma24 family protein
VDRKQERAFEEFVAESGDSLLRLATLLTSDTGLGEDVYQETLHPSPLDGLGWRTRGRSAAR